MNKRTFTRRLLVLAAALPFLLPAGLAHASYAGVGTTSKTVNGHQAELVYVNLGDPTLQVQVVNADGKVGDTDSLASIAQSHEALAAMNGGYFNSYSDKQPLTVVRANGVFDHNGSFGAIFGIDLLNRTYFGRVYPTIEGSTDGSWSWPHNWAAWGINHYYDNPKAITVLTPDVKKQTLTGGRTVVVQNGVVTAVVTGDASIPADGYLIHYGTDVASSADLFYVGQKVAYRIDYKDENGKTLNLDPMLNLMGGGPLLVHEGQVVIDPQKEQFTDPKQTSPNVRATHTFIGVDGENHLIMGTVDGVSVYELADAVKQLGLVEAVGMDSGASAGLYADGSYLTAPGRDVPNAIIVTRQADLPQHESGYFDVDDHNWALSAIEDLREKGIMVGSRINGKQAFFPQDNLTRGEFATLLVKAFGLTPNPLHSFPDTEGKWYQGTVGAVADAGWMQGYSAEEFGPDDPVTEEQVIVILAKILAQKGAPLTAPDRDLSVTLSSWATQGVHTAIRQGLLGEQFGNQSFAPQERANRASVAVTVDLALQKLGQ